VVQSKALNGLFVEYVPLAEATKGDGALSVVMLTGLTLGLAT
jgi:hypothetical protein